MKKSIMSYDTNVVKKGFYFDFELLAKFYKCRMTEIVFLGHSASGNSVYSTPKGNMAIVTKSCDHNFETGRGSFIFRPDTGSIEKLNKRNVEYFRKEQNDFLENLKMEGSQLRVPDIKTFKSLPEAIAGYTSVVANAFGCGEDQHNQVMALKKDLHKWIEREDYSTN